jgi:hypothetical protein
MHRLVAIASSPVVVRVFVYLLVGLFCTQSALASPKRKPSILYVHTNTFSPAATADVVSRLNSSGLFETIDNFDGRDATPALALLNAYDAVLVAPNGPWASPADMGTALAAYVDGGGGVVMALFATSNTTSGPAFLAGNWTAAYNCMVPGPSSFGTGSFTLGAIPDQNHPIMIGVEAFDGGFRSFRPTNTTLAPGATLIASWSDGKPLVAVGPKLNRCDLGFFLNSSDLNPDQWDSGTDGAKLMVNALLHVIRPKVLILGAELQTWAADVKAKISSTNAFIRVDFLDVSTFTPTLAELQKYDAVFVWSDVPYANPTAMGNVLADYTDAGGGVVLAVHTKAQFSPSLRPGGRWIFGGYEIIPEGTDPTFGPASLGTIVYPDHPIMKNVTTFNGGSASLRPTPTSLNPGGLVVAKWSDGKTLAAVSMKMPNRVDLGFFPPSSAASSGLWEGDGAKLMINSLLYTMKPYVGCVAADDAGNAADVVNKLTASRRFSGVTFISASAATPSLASMSQFHAIATWSNFPYNNPAATGDAFADYLDVGGGVVTAILGNVAGLTPTGRWQSDGYDIVTAPLPGLASGPQTLLGTIVEPNHPIARFVRKFDGGGSSFRFNSVPPLRGRTILNWSDGTMLASAHSFRKRADLGYWPVSGGWNGRTDGTWITANALEFVALINPCPGDFNGDGLVDDADFTIFVGYYNTLLDPRGDLNGDGLTEDADFSVFVGSYNNLVCP